MIWILNKLETLFLSHDFCFSSSYLDERENNTNLYQLYSHLSINVPMSVEYVMCMHLYFLMFNM